MYIEYKNQEELNVISFLLALNSKHYIFGREKAYFFDYESFPDRVISVSEHSKMIRIVPLIDLEDDDEEYEILTYKQFLMNIKINYKPTNYIVDPKYILENNIIIPIFDKCALLLTTKDLKIVPQDSEIIPNTTIDELRSFIQINFGNNLCKGGIF